MSAVATAHIDTEAVIEPSEAAPSSGLVERFLTLLFVVGPMVGLGFAIATLWGRGVSARDLVLALILYAVTGHGISVGFHRLFAHRSFHPVRPVKVALAVAGSMAFQGGPIGWVRNHRQHHVHSDREGDPHSPVTARPGARAALAGLFHAHVGWLFRPVRALTSRVADLQADRDLRIVDRLFPLWCVVSLVIPFGVGWLWGGRVGAGVTAFLWAGLVRVFVLHHVTWSVNSICHRFGRRPNTTPDRSANVAVLAVASFGESWHNNHHAHPRSARYGGRGQWDSSAAIIRAFERLGLARDVHWSARPHGQTP